MDGNTSKCDVFTEMVADGRASKRNIFTEKLPEARYTETQKQIAQLVNGFHQLQQQLLMQQQQKPPSSTIKKTPTPDSVQQVSTRQLRPALPNEFDGDHSKGATFLQSCQTYILVPRILL